MLFYLMSIHVLCVLSSHLFWMDVRHVDVPAGVTQDFSSTFLFAVLALIFSREKDSAVPFPRRPRRSRIFVY